MVRFWVSVMVCSCDGIVLVQGGGRWVSQRGVGVGCGTVKDVK
jgi:hypothetical protein